MTAETISSAVVRTVKDALETEFDLMLPEGAVRLDATVEDIVRAVAEILEKL